MPQHDDRPAFSGPLSGLKVIEIGSIGPGPFCAMLLADLGADIIRVDRVSGSALVGPSDNFRTELLNRGRRSIAVDLKHPAGAEIVLALVEQADVIMEGFRPGVAERLGIGPEDCAARNPAIIYGRMTGFGQDGPLAQAVGHDINYLALSGLLSMVGRNGQPPTPPLALAGDFGGGGMILALGILAAVFERGRSGRGQVIDAAMVHGAALLGTCFYGYRQTGEWNVERGTNIVDSGAPYYDAYETADGKWLAVGAMEAHFYADLIKLLELPDDLPDQNDQGSWPEMKVVFAEAVKRRTLADWLSRAEGLSPCVSPVLDALEAPAHPHHVARGTFIELDGLVQPSPAPRFSRTPATVDRRPPVPGEHTAAALADWGIPAGQVAEWLDSGAAADRSEGS